MNIRTKTIFAVAALFFTTAFTNDAKAQDSEVGIKGGANFSNFFNDEVDDQNLRIGFQGGLFFKAALTDFFAIQPEVLYTQKGSTTKYDKFLTGEGDITQKLDYIEVPILAVINLGENLNVHAGPYLAYLMNASIENNNENNVFDGIEELNEGDYERLDFGLAVGVGFEFEVIRFGIRYDYGLKNVGKDQDFTLNGSKVSSDILKNSKNSTASLYVGIGF